MHAGSVAWLAMRRLVFAMTLAPAVAFGADTFNATLAPKAMHEECVKLQAGEKRDYYWKADNAVDFNVHYHEGNDVSYPIKREGMRGDGGSFVAKKAQDYCWMWTSRDKPAQLEGKIEDK